MSILVFKPFISGKMPDIPSLLTRWLGIPEHKNERDTINNPYVQLFKAPAAGYCVQSLKVLKSAAQAYNETEWEQTNGQLHVVSAKTVLCTQWFWGGKGEAPRSVCEGSVSE